MLTVLMFKVVLLMRQAPCPFYMTVQTPWDLLPPPPSGIYLCEEAVIGVAKKHPEHT